VEEEGDCLPLDVLLLAGVPVGDELRLVVFVDNVEPDGEPLGAPVFFAAGSFNDCC
jgi:hypothetical protein